MRSEKQTVFANYEKILTLVDIQMAYGIAGIQQAVKRVKAIRYKVIVSGELEKSRKYGRNELTKRRHLFFNFIFYLLSSFYFNSSI